MARVRLKTACPLDCWDACAIEATVEDGKLVKLGGDPDHPVTRGFLCGKTMRYGERVYSPERILHPLRKKADGTFERIAWDGALDLLEAKFHAALEEHGPLSILHLQDGGNMGVMKKLSKRFFNLLGGHTEFTGDVCFGAGEAAMNECFGRPAAHAPSDLVNSRIILFWGRDPFTTHIHWIPFLKAAKAAGAKLVSLNPIRIDRSGLFDEQLQPRPGSDLVLAAWLCRRALDSGRADADALARATNGFPEFAAQLAGVTLEKAAAATGLAAAELETLAAAYLDAAPAAIYFGAGLQHHANGVETAGLLCALGMLAGNLGRPGGGVSFYNAHRTAFRYEERQNPEGAAVRGVPQAQFARLVPELRDPPARILWINGSNPARTLPDSAAVATAIRSVPFVVAVDFIPNDTTALADLVLPATSFLEEGGLVTSYGQDYISGMAPVIDRVGEARTDLEIFRALGERFGIGERLPRDERDWRDEMVRESLGDAGAAEFARRNFIANPATPAVPFAGGRFATPDGKFRFPARTGLDASWPAPSAEFPLQLLSPKNPRRLNSQAPANEAERPPQVFLHPETAQSLGLQIGDAVWVESDRARVPARLAVDDAIHPACASFPVAGASRRGTGVNLLSGPSCDKSGYCPAYYTTFVRLFSGTAAAFPLRTVATE